MGFPLLQCLAKPKWHGDILSITIVILTSEVFKKKTRKSAHVWCIKTCCDWLDLANWISGRKKETAFNSSLKVTWKLWRTGPPESLESPPASQSKETMCSHCPDRVAWSQDADPRGRVASSSPHSMLFFPSQRSAVSAPRKQIYTNWLLPPALVRTRLNCNWKEPPRKSHTHHISWPPTPRSSVE